MGTRPFAGFNTRPSPWGYNWTTENISTTEYRNSPPCKENDAQGSPMSTTSSPEPQMMANQYAHLPAALLTTLKRDKKPFTYTPGGVNLSEVLNARLQKRIERKKKYHEERSTPTDPKFESPKQVIVMPTYNTPLDMYSMENALEALEVQAELVAADKSLSSPSRSATLPRNHTFRFDEKEFDKGVAQSKAFKVLQIITDTEEENANRGKSGYHQDEMRFTGIRDSKSIPSKFFQTLQKITGTEEDEEEEADPRNGMRTDAPRCVVFEKQQGRPGFLPQNNSQISNPVVATNHHYTAPPQQNYATQGPVNSPNLKRPAAFLPMKTGSDPLNRFKSVHPTFLSNGPRKVHFPPGVSDF